MAPHPMTKPNTWALWSGAGGLPSIRRAAAAFWLLGACMVIAWVVGLIHEALIWGSSPLLLVAGLSVAAGWCWLAWSTWSTWRADRSHLTLLWTGPVRNVQEDGHTLAVGGFRVAQWDAPVRLEVLVDLQRWMLLRVTSIQANNPRQSWIWLDARAQRPEIVGGMSRNSLHQLRSLVYLPVRLTTAGSAASPLYGGGIRRLIHAVASWAHSIKSGFSVRSSVMPHGSFQAPGHLRAGAESAFPSTLVMRDDDCKDALIAPSGERG